MSLRLTNLSKRFGLKAVVQEVNLEVGDGEVLVLLGPSGCGKSTTLRMIAGLERPDQGDVFMDGTRVTDIPAHRRDVAFVFQRPTFLPNRSVAENIAYPLACREGSWLDLLRGHFRSSHLETARHWAARLSIDHLTDRYPDTLSGGEAQRAALARALSKRASVLLLDEPLANVDVQLRHSLRQEILQIRDLARSAGRGAMIYVTHDQEDALLLGDRVALMREGRLVQLGSPAELYREPADLFAAQFLSGPGLNLVRGRLASVTEQTLRVFALGGEIELSRRPGPTNLQPDQEILLGFRVQPLVASPTGSFKGRVVELRDLGSQLHAVLDCGGDMIRMALPMGLDGQLRKNIRFTVSSDRLFAFHPVDGSRLH